MDNTNRGMHGDSLPMLSPVRAIEQETPAFSDGVHHHALNEIAISSSLTGITYTMSDCVRILNPVQVSAYIRHGAKLIDLVIGDENKLVFIFDKKSTAYLYELWLIRELK